MSADVRALIRTLLTRSDATGYDLSNVPDATWDEWQTIAEFEVNAADLGSRYSYVVALLTIDGVVTSQRGTTGALTARSKSDGGKSVAFATPDGSPGTPWGEKAQAIIAQSTAFLPITLR